MCKPLSVLADVSELRGYLLDAVEHMGLGTEADQVEVWEQRNAFRRAFGGLEGVVDGETVRAPSYLDEYWHAFRFAPLITPRSELGKQSWTNFWHNWEHDLRQRPLRRGHRDAVHRLRK